MLRDYTPVEGNPSAFLPAKRAAALAKFGMTAPHPSPTEPFEGTVPSVQADYPWPGRSIEATQPEAVQPDADLVAQA